MKRMAKLLGGIPEPARGRVVRWLTDKYAASHTTSGPSNGFDVP